MITNPPANEEDVRGTGSTPESGRSPGGRTGQPTQVFLPGESTVEEAWQARVHRVARVGHN